MLSDDWVSALLWRLCLPLLRTTRTGPVTSHMEWRVANGHVKTKRKLFRFHGAYLLPPSLSSSSSFSGVGNGVGLRLLA